MVKENQADHKEIGYHEQDPQILEILELSDKRL